MRMRTHNMHPRNLDEFATESVFPEMEATPDHVRHFTCSTADLAQVTPILGRPATRAALLAGVSRSVNRAIVMARAAAGALRPKPRSAHVTALFRSSFGALPTAVPSWRTPAAQWADLGELVALRLESAARILGDGSIRYFCWGSALHCPECTTLPTTYRACSSFQARSVICIGVQFWQWLRAGRFNFMASTLLHEALHIYFSFAAAHGAHTSLRSGAAGPFRTVNANCYQSFVLRFNRR